MKKSPPLRSSLQMFFLAAATAVSIALRKAVGQPTILSPSPFV
jgi:hypothetical protein